MKVSQLADAEFLTVDDVHRRLRHLSLNGVYAAIRRKEIPSVQFGRRILVPKAAIDRLAQLADAETVGGQRAGAGGS